MIIRFVSPPFQGRDASEWSSAHFDQVNLIECVIARARKLMQFPKQSSYLQDGLEPAGGEPFLFAQEAAASEFGFDSG
jgi:hypothetical protein